MAQQVTLHLDVTMPAAELARFLQVLRAWDRALETIVMRMQVEAPSLTTAEIEAILDTLDPPLPYRVVLHRPEQAEGLGE
jgi:hypothetical protein